MEQLAPYYPKTKLPARGLSCKWISIFLLSVVFTLGFVNDGYTKSVEDTVDDVRTVKTELVYFEKDFIPRNLEWSPTGDLVAIEGGTPGDPMKLVLANVNKPGRPLRVGEGRIRHPKFRSQDGLYYVEVSGNRARLMHQKIQRLEAEMDLDDPLGIADDVGDDALTVVSSTGEIILGDLTDPSRIIYPELVTAVAKTKGHIELFKAGGETRYRFTEGGRSAAFQVGDAELVRPGLVRYKVNKSTGSWVYDDGQKKTMLRRFGKDLDQTADLSSDGRFLIYDNSGSNGLDLASHIVVRDLLLKRTVVLEKPQDSNPTVPRLSPKENAIAWIDQNPGRVYVSYVEGIQAR